MPYYRRRRRSNPYRRKIRFERRKSRTSNATHKVARGKKASQYDIAQIARDVVKYGAIAGSLMSKVNSELKFYDKTMINGFLPTGGWATPVSITDIPQGDTQTARDGDSILLKKLQLKGTMSVNTSATIGTNIRVVIFKRPVNQTVPTATEYATADINAFRNLDFTTYYQTVLDKVYTLSTATGDKSRIQIDMNIPFDNHVVYEDATTDAGAKNALYFTAMQTDAVNVPTMTLYSRLRFYDN